MHWLAVDLNPNPSALPGFGTLQSLTNAVAAFGLLLCLLAAIIGAISWAFGASSSNAVTASAGKKAVGGAIAGAVIIGAAATLVNFFYNTGHGIHG